MAADVEFTDNSEFLSGATGAKEKRGDKKRKKNFKKV